jgi:UDP-N-acetylmuramoyl-L-alanyl-D-glutamate--2,6-diaminopimelate ligase
MNVDALDALIDSLRRLAPGGAAMTADSRRVHRGDLFLALPGQVHDGRQHIPAAIQAGASAVVWAPQGFAWPADWPLANFPLPEGRHAAAALAARWWGNPSEALWMIGITGTNGKTSCSHWLASALDGLGRKTATIGTLGNGFAGALEGSSHTTPDAVSLHGLLAGYRAAGAAGVAMEVSSHALDQGRVEGVAFDVAVLTNLSRDHLDYHGDMAAYAHAKARLFDWPGLKTAVINQDDEFGQRLLQDLRGGSARSLSYGIDSGDIHCNRLDLTAAGLSMRVATPWGTGELTAATIGRFNAANLLACLGVLLASDVALDAALAALSQVQPVAGRMQRLGGAGLPDVIVDFAHTPDALDKTLATLRDLTAGRLICVFGCGGGRDKGKRVLMGGIAASRADLAIVTSDNPRNEEPADIVADILEGMPPGQRVLLDRTEAIQQAIAEARPGDVVLIAGKGHEDYQEIKGVRRPFSDLVEATRVLKEKTHALA